MVQVAFLGILGSSEQASESKFEFAQQKIQAFA